MAAIISALVLGILLNMSTLGGNVFPIGSVIAIVIIGIYLKRNQDKHFDEIMKRLENDSKTDRDSGT